MRAILLAHDIDGLRRVLCDLLVARVLRIENAEHIRVDAALRLRRERVAVLAEILRQRLSDLGLALRVAERVDHELVLY